MTSTGSNIFDNQGIRTEPVSKCVLCNSSGEIVVKDASDAIYSAVGLWNYRKCNNRYCKLHWIDPRPIPEDLPLVYKNYYTHDDSGLFIHPLIAKLEKSYYRIKYGYYTTERGIPASTKGLLLWLLPTEKRELDFKLLYLKNSEKGKLLDIGCGNGWYIKQMEALGWEVEGIDFDSEAVSYCQDQRLKVQQGAIEDQKYTNNSFDVIVINNVIEHLSNPLLTLQECFRILKPHGKLVIATPNSNSLLFKVFKKNWYALQAPAHLQLYNKRNLKFMVNKAGFRTKWVAATVRNDYWIYLTSKRIKSEGRIDLKNLKFSLAEILISKFVQLSIWYINIVCRSVGGELHLVAEKQITKDVG